MVIRIYMGNNGVVLGMNREAKTKWVSKSNSPTYVYVYLLHSIYVVHANSSQ